MGRVCEAGLNIFSREFVTGVLQTLGSGCMSFLIAWLMVRLSSKCRKALKTARLYVRQKTYLEELETAGSAMAADKVAADKAAYHRFLSFVAQKPMGLRMFSIALRPPCFWAVIIRLGIQIPLTYTFFWKMMKMMA